MPYTSKRLLVPFIRCAFLIFCCQISMAQAKSDFEYPHLVGSPNILRDVAHLFQTDSAVRFTAVELRQKILTSQLLPEFSGDAVSPEHYVSIAEDRNSFWVLTEERVHHESDAPGAVPWRHTEWLRYGFNGRVIDVLNADPASHEALGEPLSAEAELNWPDKPRKDAAAFVAFEAFKKHRFIWSSLNPLRGLGNPTGSTPNKDWDGIAEITLRLNNTVFTFPVQTHSSIDKGYQFQLIAYSLPTKQHSALLYIQSSPSGEQRPHALTKGLYLVTCEDC